MILDNHYALVCRPNLPRVKKKQRVQMMIVSASGWMFAQLMHREGHIVILECWDITHGKCISN